MGEINGNRRTGRKVFKIVVSISILVIIKSVTSVTSLPNIRIQVNNENLQHPPYLLDAVRQIEKAEQEASAKATSELHAPSNPTAGTNGESQFASPLGGGGSDEKLSSSVDVDQHSSQSIPTAGLVSETKEVALDETANFELEPQHSKPAQSGASADNGGESLLEGHETAQQGSSENRDDFNKPVNGNRNFHLDVTSSHQKRPPMASSAALIDEELSESSSGQQVTLIKNSVMSQPAQSPTSNVSPTVTSDEMAQPNGKREIALSAPDTLEPSQVMQGVTNASLVPATVRRHYGHQTRTRITLGGGYQRDQQQPSVNPSSSEHVDDKPAVSLLERPDKRDQHPQPSSLQDNSRVIEVPERIVLPLSVFKQNVANETDKPSASVVPKRRDTRCPSNGVTTLEHPTACDRYFLCENGLISEQVCPNGLMYGTRDIVRDFCVHRWQAVCGDKTIPNPISSPGCRWQNGLFNVQGSPKCTPDFYECTDGLFEVKKCTISGQVYDDKTKSCRYAEQVGCAQEALADFQCPADDQANTYWPFPRYFLNERALIHCVSDKPQIIRCRDHERVDPEHLFCVPIDKNAPPVNEEGSPAQLVVEARRAATNPREKGKKDKKID